MVLLWLYKNQNRNNFMDTVPNHIGIIIDGNRRWAKEKHLPTFMGHRKGISGVKKILYYAQKLNVKMLTAYGFSTENWKRDSKEVNHLMNLFEEFVDKNINDMHKKGIRLRHLGSPSRLPETLQNKIREAVELTKNNTKMIFQLAINYGGRDELVRAVKKIINDKIKPEDISEHTISESLDTCDLPDPDLIIRTSGEHRLSGFLTWQTAYSELYFPNCMWPDFDESELDKALAEFSRRQRRFGK